MRTSLFRLGDVGRTLGAQRAIRVAAHWVVRREYLVLVRDLRVPPPPVPPALALRWTSLCEEGFTSLARLNPTLSSREVGRRLREGQECLVGWMDSEPVYYRWETTRAAHLPYLHRRFRPEPGDLLVVDEYTTPDLRSRGIASAASVVGLARARARGLTRSIALVAWWNAPALRATQDRPGRRLVGTVGYRWGLARRCYFATGAVCLDAGGDIRVAAE